MSRMTTLKPCERSMQVVHPQEDASASATSLCRHCDKSRQIRGICLELSYHTNNHQSKTRAATSETKTQESLNAHGIIAIARGRSSIVTCICAPATILLDTLRTPIGKTARPSVGVKSACDAPPAPPACRGAVWRDPGLQDKQRARRARRGDDLRDEQDDLRTDGTIYVR